MVFSFARLPPERTRPAADASACCQCRAVLSYIVPSESPFVKPAPPESPVSVQPRASGLLTLSP